MDSLLSILDHVHQPAAGWLAGICALLTIIAFGEGGMKGGRTRVPSVVLGWRDLINSK